MSVCTLNMPFAELRKAIRYAKRAAGNNTPRIFLEPHRGGIVISGTDNHRLHSTYLLCRVTGVVPVTYLSHSVTKAILNVSTKLAKKATVEVVLERKSDSEYDVRYSVSHGKVYLEEHIGLASDTIASSSIVINAVRATDSSAKGTITGDAKLLARAFCLDKKPRLSTTINNGISIGKIIPHTEFEYTGKTDLFINADHLAAALSGLQGNVVLECYGETEPILVTGENTVAAIASLLV